MALGASSLTRGASTTNQSTAYTTASFTSTTGNWLLVCVSGTGSTITWTVAGHSLTWSQVDRQTNGTTASVQWIKAKVTTGATGTLSITPSASATGCAWSVIEVTGADTTDVVGGSLPVKTTGTNVLSQTFNTPTQSNANNRPMLGLNNLDNNSVSITAPANWAELDEQAYNTPGTKVWTGWASATYPSSVSITEETTIDWAGITLEIVAASTPGATVQKKPSPTTARFRASNW